MVNQLTWNYEPGLRTKLRMKRSFIPTPKVFLIVSCGIVGILFIISVIYTAIPSRRPVTVTPRSISSSRFAVIWTKSDTDIRGGIYQPPFLNIRGDCVLIIDYRYVLECLNIESGELIWQTPDTRSGSDFISNEATVFVSFNERSRCDPLKDFTPQCERTKVTAYDIRSGQIKWSEIYGGMGVVSQMSANETTLVISGGGGHGSYGAVMTIDAETGSLLEYEELAPTFTRRPIKEEDPDFQMPVERDEIVSNFAVMDGVIYFLTSDAMLWAVDETTGTVLETASFEPAQSPLSNLDEYYIAADNGTIVVYLYDSQQLFALKVQ